MHQALKDILGNHVNQKGSNITADRLRFDFSHPRKMSSEEIQQVEYIVNSKIKKNLAVNYELMTRIDAEQSGAIALFSKKYEDLVKVYSIENYSIELCSGPHVNNTNQLGFFKIIKESSSSSGVRRIRAVLKSL